MPNASTPFKAKSPFHSRVVGLDYKAFGLDFLNPAFPTAFGCLSVTPTIDLNSTGHEGGPFTPASTTYTLTNTGGTTMDWNISLSQTWLTTTTSGGTLLPGETFDITVTVAGELLPQNPVPYTGIIAFSNDTNGCGDTNINVNLTVTGDLTLTVEGRRKGGVATMCGYSEYISSSPPKKYLVRTLSGAVDSIFYPLPSCSGPPNCHVVDTYSGTCSYDPSTGCIEANTGGKITRTIPIGPCFAPGVFPRCEIAGYSFGQHGEPNIFDEHTVITATTKTISGAHLCYTDGPASITRTDQPRAETLSSEDTEAAAIARLMASSSYSAWATLAARGDIKSEYENRTSTFSITYWYAQWRVSATGLTPATIYNGSATIFRRIWGSSDPWDFVSTQGISGTTDGSGNFADGPFDLPETPGYEYTVWNAGLTP